MGEVPQKISSSIKPKDDEAVSEYRAKREHFNSFFPTGDYRERKFRSQWTSRRAELAEEFSDLCIARNEETYRKNKL